MRRAETRPADLHASSIALPPVQVPRDIRAIRQTWTVAGLTFFCMVPVTLLVAPLKELVALPYGASSFWTHSFMSVNMIGAVLAAPLIGRLADRRRRRVAVFALVAEAGFLCAMGWAPGLAWLLILRFLEGAAHILALSTLMAIAASWAQPGRRGRVMGLVGAAMMFGTACGTRLGGLAWRAAPDWTFQTAGAVALIAAFTASLLLVEPTVPAHRSDGLRQAMALLRRRPRLLIAYAYALIDRLCVGVVITTFGLFLADAHGLDPGARSRLLIAFLLPFAGLVYPAGRMVDRVGRVWPIALGSIAFGVTFATYGLLSLSGLHVAMVLSGVFSAAMFAPNLTLCADLAGEEDRGAAFTGFNVAGSLGFILGPLAAGALFASLAGHYATLTAYRATFIAAGATEVLCALVTLPFLIRLKRDGPAH